MATWREISLDNYRAAGDLLRSERWRSSVSRAYYAAFSAITSILTGVATFPAGYETPPHKNLVGYINKYLAHLGKSGLRNLKAAIRRLYFARILSDYRSAITTDKGSAFSAINDVVVVYRTLGIDYAK